jgi:putative membrane protein
LGIWTDALIRSLFERSALARLGRDCGSSNCRRGAAGADHPRDHRHPPPGQGCASAREAVAAKSRSATPKEARALAGEVSALIAVNPLSARGRKNLKALDDEIIDGPHYLAFAERELMTPLDRQARQLTRQRGAPGFGRHRGQPARLRRPRLCRFRGGPPDPRHGRALWRPARAIGMIRLFRDVIAHLAVTGAVAAGDSLIQQVVGHGLAAKLSAGLAKA